MVALALCLLLVVLQPPLHSSLAAASVVDAVAGLHWEPLIQDLVAEGFPEPLLREHFDDPRAAYLPEAMGAKLASLYRKKFLPAPASTKRPSDAPSVYRSCLTTERVKEARAFLSANAALLKGVEKSYGVPREIVTAVMAVETRLGTFLGTQSAFSTLASMALARDPLVARAVFPPGPLSPEQESWLLGKAREKGDWAFEELKALIEYAYDNGLPPLECNGSVYGAIGVSQFMPTNALLYGVDGDQDGRVNLFNLSDAAYSMANYLQAHGWKRKLSSAGQYRVLYRYNHSSTYANTILALARALRR